MSDFKTEGDFKISAINQETNAGTHNQGRAMSEAADLNDFFNANAELQERILGRTASFCTERSGHFDAFDQGISFFLPNASWCDIVVALPLPSPPSVQWRTNQY